MNIDAWIYSISGWLTKHEGNFLYAAAKSVNLLPGDVVEIGSFEGKSTIFLARAASHVTAIDPHKGDVSGGTVSPTYDAFIHHLTKAGVIKKVTPIVETSKTAALHWNTPISLLFIDGLHDEAHAKEDFSLWSPHVVEGGIIAMHDSFCGWSGAVSVAMNNIVRSDDFSEIGVVGSIIYGVKGSAGKNRTLKIFRRHCIDLCQNIYGNTAIPQWIRYILVHKLLRLLLLNRFSSFV